MEMMPTRRYQHAEELKRALTIVVPPTQIYQQPAPRPTVVIPQAKPTQRVSSSKQPRRVNPLLSILGIGVLLLVISGAAIWNFPKLYPMLPNPTNAPRSTEIASSKDGMTLIYGQPVRSRWAVTLATALKNLPTPSRSTLIGLTRPR